MIRCVLVAQDDFDNVYEFDTREEFKAFRKGAYRATNMFGGGSISVLELSDLEETRLALAEGFNKSHDAACIAAIEKYLLPETA